MKQNTAYDINIQARSLAQAAVEGLSVNPTGLVAYHSHGNLVIIGNQEAIEVVKWWNREYHVLILRQLCKRSITDR